MRIEGSARRRGEGDALPPPEAAKPLIWGRSTPRSGGGWGHLKVWSVDHHRDKYGNRGRNGKTTSKSFMQRSATPIIDRM